MTAEIKRILEDNGIKEISEATPEQAEAAIQALRAESARLSRVSRGQLAEVYREADQLETRAAMARAVRRG